ncbi:serine/threonine-protein phosphatase [Striga asiatica]|uniref:Serine/threonine-protein phosphatase n=1 Tax=Striga asiatica TaxID=4170 RepID=A0A5A7Q4A4_STRAF|nr:serine/threonine-protein phosphatase [Striga asiatica]
MWSDLEEIETWVVSPRGTGWFFCYGVSSSFYHINKLDLVCRAKEYRKIKKTRTFSSEDKDILEGDDANQVPEQPNAAQAIVRTVADHTILVSRQPSQANGDSRGARPRAGKPCRAAMCQREQGPN